MTDHDKISCLTDRPCTACKFHKEEGCSKWSCVFEDKSGDTEGEYIKIDDLDDTVLRLNNDGWEITRNEHKLISNVLYEMPLYSFPNIEKGEWIPISERLPQIGQYVLCSLKDFADYRIIIAQYNSAKWWDYVEAWQPLPEPYKAESEE